MDEDKLRQRIAKILMRLEDAAALALDAQAPDLSLVDRHGLVSQVEAQINRAKPDCTAATRILQNLIRQQSK